MQSHSYTGEGQVHSITETLNGVTTMYLYQYDTLGNLIGSEKRAGGSPVMRTGRTNGTNTYEYIYAGDKLVRMVKNGEVVDFGYAGGQLATMTYDGVTYYYVLNGQGDVVAVTDNTGKAVLAYHYSAYGVPYLLRADDTLTPILKSLNPFMYRGYVYDTETTLYYLQSRYYDPEIGRFINADAFVSTGQGVLGTNMFAYCNNNPVIYSDQSGLKPQITPIEFKQHKSEMKDVTQEVMAALNSACERGRELRNKINMLEPEAGVLLGELYADFYLLVDHEAPWDIKRKAPWEETIGTAFPGQNIEVIFKGMIMTPEMLGNYTYGYLGHAYGIPLPILIAGSYYAAGCPQRGEALKNETWDWNFITRGYHDYH